MVILAIFQPPESPVLREQQNTRAVLDKRDLGVGTVYVSERTLCWRGQEGSGFCIEYPHISMHAISTDPTVYPTQCLFILIDGHMTMPGTGADTPQLNRSEDTSDSDSDTEPDVSELVLVPPDPSSISAIYNAVGRCQSLNPDPDDFADEDENVYQDAEDYIEDFASHSSLSDFGAGGDTELNYLASQLQNHSIHNNYYYGNGDQNFDDDDDDQFEDAD